jgi:hypothetical protein
MDVELERGIEFYEFGEIRFKEVAGLGRGLRLQCFGAQLFHWPQRLDFEGLRYLLGKRNALSKSDEGTDSEQHRATIYNRIAVELCPRIYTVMW